jgi:Cu-Zn family superoxide dismutase
MRRQSLAACLLLPLIACGGSAPESTADSATPAAPAAPTTVALPEAVSFPEGIAYDASAGVLYTASAENGAVARIDAEAGTTAVVVPGGTIVPADSTVFPGPLGMTVADDRLWVAGGLTGTVTVLNTSDWSIVKQVTVPTAPKSLLNDVAIAGGAAFITDTFVPTLWRMPIQGDTIGDPEPWLDLSGSAIEYGDGPNLNGIVATPDGESLIVVQMNVGRLFRIDVETKAIAQIDVAGADLTTGDGLALDGDILYVVRQGAGEVATVRLNQDLTGGTVVSRFSEGLAWPATAAVVGDELVVVNTQFNTRGSEPSTTRRPFTLLRIPASRLGAD